MAELRDTIAIIDKRDAEIRLLAGLPDPDSGLVAAQLPLDVDTLIVRANALSASFAAVSTSLSKNNERLSATPSIMPTRAGSRVNSRSPGSIRSCTARGRTRASTSRRPMARPWSHPRPAS